MKTGCLFLFLTLAFMQPIGFSAGLVEHRQISSQAFVDAGITTNQREINVYLPEGYAESGRAYPVLYLLHGGWWGNWPDASEVFLGSGYSGVMSDANAAAIADRLIDANMINPLIIVMPDMSIPRAKPDDYSADMALAVEYIRDELIRNTMAFAWRPFFSWQRNDLAHLMSGDGACA